MGHVFDDKDSELFDRWFKDPANRCRHIMGGALMMEMLRPVKGGALLDIGCGTGVILNQAVELGLDATGIDPSSYLVDILSEKFGNKVTVHKGFGENLPFEDNTFHYCSIVSSLEFVDNPEVVLREAARVTKDKLFIGIINRYAASGIRMRLQGLFKESLFKKARFYSIWELKQLLRSILGEVPIEWQTVGNLPTSSESNLYARIENSHLIRRSPFGSFAGILVELVPRYRTRPLSLRVAPKNTTKAAAGCHFPSIPASNRRTRV